MHTRSYTSTPNLPTPICDESGKEVHFVTYPAVAPHGLMNASILAFFKQWNTTDYGPGKPGSHMANGQFQPFQSSL
jgi:hypothetical protein